MYLKLLLIIPILLFFIPIANADELDPLDDSSYWELDGGILSIGMSPSNEPHVGDTVTIRCGPRSGPTGEHILPNNISPTMTLTIIDGAQNTEVFSGYSGVDVIFQTGKTIRVACFTEMIEGLGEKELHATYEFAPKPNASYHENEDVPIIATGFNIGIPTTENTISDDTTTIKKSGGGCNDCTPPTLGYNSDGIKQVDDGICINDSCMDGGYFHTEYPMQNTFLYYPNVISTKYYENGGASNIKITQLGIGVNQIGTPISESQAIIEVHMAYFSNDLENPKIKEIILIDPDNIIDRYTADIELVPCIDGSKKNCLQTNYYYSYSKVPISPVLMSNAIDYKRNTINSYFNEGLDVYNPTPIIITTELIKEKKCEIKMVTKRNNPCQFLPLINHEIEKAENIINEIYLTKNISHSDDIFIHNNKILRQYE